MKVELTNELKARFFALYWGQRVWPNQFTVDGQMNSLSEEAMDALFVELRPLSSITEEEIHGLCDLLWGDISYQDLYKLIFLNANADLQISNVAIDYLRSLSIATDFMGIPVEQWIEWGVVKLK